MKTISSAQIVRVMRIILFLMIAENMLFLTGTPVWENGALIGGAALLLLNDQLRINYWKKREYPWLTALSYIISILGTGFYLYKYSTSVPINIYFIFPLVELFIGNTPFLYGWIAFHFSVFLLINRLVQPTESPLTLLIVYALILTILYLFRKNNEEKQISKQLNAELQEANRKLLEYSQNVKQIAVAEERTRIAQELHDAMGHGLVALGMNLEYAEHVLQADPSKAKEALVRAHGQSKTCMEDLRKAVSVLKQEAPGETSSLYGQLRQLLSGLQSGGVNAELEVSPQAEIASPAIRTCLFKTVREAVTNGIRHGGATTFQIHITGDGQLLSLTVRDNGTGCTELNKSHGLAGLEERVTALGGQVSFPAVDSGFCLAAAIPFRKEEKT